MRSVSVIAIFQQLFAAISMLGFQIVDAIRKNSADIHKDTPRANAEKPASEEKGDSQARRSACKCK